MAGCARGIVNKDKVVSVFVGVFLPRLMSLSRNSESAVLNLIVNKSVAPIHFRRSVGSMACVMLRPLDPSSDDIFWDEKMYVSRVAVVLCHTLLLLVCSCSCQSYESLAFAISNYCVQKNESVLLLSGDCTHVGVIPEVVFSDDLRMLLSMKDILIIDRSNLKKTECIDYPCIFSSTPVYSIIGRVFHSMVSLDSCTTNTRCVEEYSSQLSVSFEYVLNSTLTIEFVFEFQANTNRNKNTEFSREANHLVLFGSRILLVQHTRF